MSQQMTVTSSDAFRAALAYTGSRGWFIDHSGAQTQGLVQIRKAKKFSLGAFLAITVLSLGTLFWVYPLYHFARRAEMGNLEDVGDGSVRVMIDGKPHLWNGKDFEAPKQPSQRQTDRPS